MTDPKICLLKFKVQRCDYSFRFKFKLYNYLISRSPTMSDEHTEERLLGHLKRKKAYLIKAYHRKKVFLDFHIYTVQLVKQKLFLIKII